MRSTGEAPAHTLEQVRAILDKVGKHPRLGKLVVKECLGEWRLPPLTEEDGHHTSDLDYAVGPPAAAAREIARRLANVFKAAEIRLNDLPSEKDEELIGQINVAVKAEEKATSALQDRGVELGKLLIEAFHRYPTERPFRAFLKWTAFTTYKRAADLMFAAGGKKEGDELQRLLKRGAENTAKSRGRNKPPAITKPDVIAPPMQPAPDPEPRRPVTGNDVDNEQSARELHMSPEEKANKASGHAFSEFQFACKTYIPRMTSEADRQNARLLVADLTEKTKRAEGQKATKTKEAV